MRLSYSTILFVLLISYESRAQEIPAACFDVCDYESASSSISCSLDLDNATSWDLFLQMDCLQRAVPYTQLILYLAPRNTGPGLEVEIDLIPYEFSSLFLLTGVQCSSISPIKLSANATYPTLQFLSMAGCFDETYIKAFVQGFPSVIEIRLQQIIANSATLVGLWKLLPSLVGIELTRNVISRLDRTLFQDLANIERLILNQNSIRSLEDITFLHLTTLQRVELDYNGITQIHDRQFNQLRHLQIVKIEHNTLSSLPSTAFEECNDLSQILLGGNPLDCDCDLAWVSTIYSLYGIDFGTATCNTPTTDLITSSDLYLTCVEDDQECFNPNIVCDNGCMNTAAGFSCVCLGGYRVAGNNIDCEDIDECSVSNGNCTQTCSNTIGSFICSCQIGYELSSDNRTCEDVNECELDHGCIYGCVNAVGSYYCECVVGESVCRCQDGTQYCVHNDMCLTDATHCCPSSQYYCSVSECCVDSSTQCPPTLPADTSTPTVLVDGVATSVLVVTIREFPSALVCNFAINGVTISRAEYQVCDVEWENCVSAETDTSLPFTTTHQISALTDFQFSRCIAFTTSGDILRSLLVTPHLSQQYIATRTLPSNPAIVYVLAGDGGFCPLSCPTLDTALALSADTSQVVSQVTIQIQECDTYGSIYGLSYSLYKLEIVFDQISVFFVGNYVLTVAITELGIYTGQNVSFSFPSSQYCLAEFLHGVLWDVTSFDVTVTKKCSDLLSNGDSSMGLTRLCSASTQSWSDVVSTCYYTLGEDISSVSKIKVVLTLSKEFYLFPVIMKRQATCPQASNLFEYFQSLLSSLSLLRTERNGYFDTLWLENGEDTHTILSDEISTLTAQCYSEYWIGEVIQDNDKCDCQSKVGTNNTVFVCTEPICSCTDFSCECGSPFTGDGEHCGRDEDGDDRPGVLLPCEDERCRQDNCPLVFNPSQEDCNSDRIGDVCQQICYEEVDRVFNLTWVCTLAGETARASCVGSDQEATRYCEGNDAWAVSIDTFNCTSQFYSGLSNLSRSDALSQLATSIEQERPMYSGDIDISVAIMNDNLNRTKDPNQTERLTVVDNTLSVINQLIDVQVIDLLGQTEYKKPAAETLIRIVDTHAANILSQNTSVKLNNFTNLHFETRVLNPGDNSSEPVKLTADKLTFDNIDGQQQQQQQQPEIIIPIDQLNSTENIGVVFFVKKNIGAVLFNYGNNVTVGNTGIPTSHFRNLRIVSPLISAQVMEGGNKIKNFPNAPVQLKFPLNLPVSNIYYFRQTCVSLTDDNSGNFSTWLDVGISESTQSVSFVECNSVHFTSFAVLAAINGLENQDPALTIVSYIGVGISIVSLAICIYIYIVFGSSLLKQPHHYTHFNLIISLLLLFILFSVGLELPYRDNFGDYIPCKIASGLLQYLVLCLFAWMLAEGIIILILMQWPFYQFTYKYAIIASLVCWITPAVYVATYTYPLHNSFLTPTNTPLNNTQISPGYCWIQSRDEYMHVHRHNLVVIVPIVAILVCNLALFLFVISKALFLYLGQKSFDKFTRSRRASLSLLRLFLVLTPAQGFLWILGLISFDPASPFAWVFTILGSLQGLFVLIFVVLFRKDIQDAILNRFSQLVTRVTSVTGQSRNVTSKS